MQSIDYSVFGIGNHPARISARNWNPSVVVAGILLIPVVLVLFIVVSSLLPWLMATAAVAVFVFLLIYGLKKSKSFDQQINLFLQANGWEAGTDSPLIHSMSKMGYKSEKSLISGELDGQPFWLYRCRPPVWQTKGGSLQEVVFLSVRFPQTLPNLLLVPNAGILGMAFDSVADKDFGLKPITLEGNFSSKVRVYGETGKHVNALEYLTPDVMDVVMREVNGIVIYSGEFMSVSVNELVDGASIKQLFNEAQVIAKELKEKMHIL